MRKRTGKKTRSSRASGEVEGVQCDIDVASAEVGRAFAQGLRTGDTFTLTSGAETYPVGGGGQFTVGPLSATVTLRQGEIPEEVYKRARVMVEVMFEAEFALKASAYEKRRREIGA